MNTGTRTLIGAIAWAAFVLAAHTVPAASAWTEVMVAFAALVLMPLIIDLAAEKRDTGTIGRAATWARVGQLPAAALLAFACGLRPGLAALLVAIPWAAVTALLAVVGLGRILRDGWSRPLDRLATDFALIYVLVGGGWLLADRGGIHPSALDSDIVALTAAHFHFAGLVLPTFAGLVLRQVPDSRFAARAVVGVVLGVPAVAIGIIVTRLGWPPAIEAAAGCALALSAMAVAVLQIRFAVDVTAENVARILLGVSGVALFFAMVLAIAYSARTFSVLLPWLGTAQMRAVHGTLNALGFGFCGAVGWWRQRRDATRLAPNAE